MKKTRCAAAPSEKAVVMLKEFKEFALKGSVISPGLGERRKRPHNL
jgi:hypothetical protein